jgi:gas vesicle protein
MSENRSGRFVLGLLLGTAVGAVAGILAAPRTGKETRQLLKKSADALPELAEDLSSSVQFQSARLSDSAWRNWDETLVRLKEAIAAGIEASQREGQILTQTEATASDPDVYSHSYASETANDPMPTETPTETIDAPES